MFEITRDNVAKFVLEKWDGYASELSGTWKDMAGTKAELAKLDKFYLTRFSDGVLDPPVRCTWQYMIGGLSRCFGSKQGITRRLYLHMMRNALIWPFQSVRPRIEFNVLTEAGITLPPDRKNFQDLFYSFNGKIFNANIRRYAAQLAVIKANVPVLQESRFSACEIGGGYGGFAELFCLNQDKLDNYYIIDLFETLALSMTYLARQSTGRRLFFVEKKDDLKNFRAKDCIVFIPSSLAEEVLQARDIRLFINSVSLIEMPWNEIEKYFRIIQARGNIYFYNFNSTSRLENGRMQFYEQMPYDSNWSTVFDRVLNIHGVVSDMRETIRFRK